MLRLHRSARDPDTAEPGPLTDRNERDFVGPALGSAGLLRRSQAPTSENRSIWNASWSVRICTIRGMRTSGRTRGSSR